LPDEPIPKPTEARSFRRVPIMIKSRLGPKPRETCEAALRDLLDRRRRERIGYHALGRRTARVSVRLPNDLYDEVRRAAEQDGVHYNEFFVTALRYHLGLR
jgi:predicted DNA binding CopG/RHH family protein